MKVGDYVRTKFGEIGKLEHIGEYNINIELGKHIQVIAKTEDYKSSPDIRDLLQVKDYVNGKQITRIVQPDICGDEELTDKKVYINDFEVYDEWIESVVTKEQFSQMEYRIGE